MALLSRITCDTCRKDKDTWHNSGSFPPTTCSECLRNKEAAAKKDHLDALAKLPTEERMRRIEEFIYEHAKSYHPGKPGRY
jgi:hypothetical protein